MSSSETPVTDQTIAVRLKIHSKGSERRIKKWLLSIQGVRRVDFDVNNGVVVVSGTIDPPTLLLMLEYYGVKAEIDGHQRRPVSPVNDNREIVAQSNKVINPLNDPDIAVLLERLPGISAGLQTVEVIKVAKLRFVFRDEENGGGGNKTLQITTKNLGGVDDQPHRGCGGFCAASSSCCGGGHHAPVVNNMHWCPHGCPHMRWQQPGYNYGGFSPLRAPPWLAIGVPSAPPLPEDDNSNSPSFHSPPPPLPPPPGSNPIYTAFSDDNTTSSCTIM